jgi:hypothetical protein
MPPQVNYQLRPAKQVQRKMLCEAFHRLTAFGELSSYRYIGFGAFFYCDFSLFHSALGIADMLSIERDEDLADRCEHNLPHNCIELLRGESNRVLLELEWDKMTILWLDYDGLLTSDVLTDISWFCEKALPGSVLVVSVNATPLTFDGDESSLLVQLRRRIGDRRELNQLDERDLEKWGTARLYRSIVDNFIREQIALRNELSADTDRIQYKQLFNFHYSDTVKMVTVGGLLYRVSQNPLLQACRFAELPFIRSDDHFYRIFVPVLTYREISYLDSQLPKKKPRRMKLRGIPLRDAESYAKIYRYFPNFAEVEI